MSANGPLAAEPRSRLLDVILRRSFRRGRFQLSSGAWSDYYLDLRRTTLDPDGLASAVALLAPRIAESGAGAVGGPTIGADPLVAGLLMHPLLRERPVLGFLVRSAPKGHGTGQQIEGHCSAGSRAVILDDVVTRGGSLLRAIQTVRAAGAEPVAAMAIVDRHEGGGEAIAAEGLDFFAIFSVEEILSAAAERGL